MRSTGVLVSISYLLSLVVTDGAFLTCSLSRCVSHDRESSLSTRDILRIRGENTGRPLASLKEFEAPPAVSLGGATMEAVVFVSNYING